MRGPLRARNWTARLGFARCACAIADADSIARPREPAISADRRIVVDGTGEFFRSVCRLAKTSDSEAGTRRRTAFKMAAGRPNLEANLWRGREDVSARPKPTGQSPQETRSREFPCLADER